MIGLVRIIRLVILGVILLVIGMVGFATSKHESLINLSLGIEFVGMYILAVATEKTYQLENKLKRLSGKTDQN